MRYLVQFQCVEIPFPGIFHGTKNTMELPMVLVWKIINESGYKTKIFLTDSLIMWTKILWFGKIKIYPLGTNVIRHVIHFKIVMLLCLQIFAILVQCVCHTLLSKKLVTVQGHMSLYNNCTVNTKKKTTKRQWLWHQRILSTGWTG